MRGSVGKVVKNARWAMNGRVSVQRPIDASGDINPLRRGIDVMQAVDHGRRSFHEPGHLDQSSGSQLDDQLCFYLLSYCCFMLIVNNYLI